MSNIKNIVIKNAKIKWAKVHEAVENYDKNGFEYSFDIALTDKQIEALRAEGMSSMVVPKKGDDGLQYITLKKPTMSKAGKDMLPIKIIGRNKEPITALLGNGTVVNAVISIFCAGGTRKACIRPETLQIVDLVVYQTADGADDLLDCLDADDDLLEDLDAASDDDEYI